MSGPDIVTHEDAAGLSADVATRLLARIGEVQADGSLCQVALTGGSIADEIHREVARLAAGCSVDWSRVEVWWGDERYVAADSEDRNALQARRAWLDHVPLDPARVHEMPALTVGVDVDTAAATYAGEVRASGPGSFDLVMLGMGPDGHVASLFPGRPQLDVTDAIAVGVTGAPKPPAERISLTFEALSRTTETWLLVSGAEKAPAVVRALARDGDVHVTPARGITSSVTWFLDRAAASELG